MSLKLGPGPHTPQSLERFYRDPEPRPWNLPDDEYLRDPVHRFRIDTLTASLNDISPNSLLDVGCGSGVLLRSFEAPFRVGCDLADRAFPNRDNLIAFAAASAESLPFRSESFDAAVCSEVLEHLLQPDTALSEIHRVLRPSGRLLITVPNLFCLDSIDGRFQIFKHIPGLLSDNEDINTHLVKDFPNAWKTRVERAGFTVLRDNPVYPIPYVPYFLRAAKRLESALMSAAPARSAVDAWTRVIARVPGLRLTGQLHFFDCQKA